MIHLHWQGSAQVHLQLELASHWAALLLHCLLLLLLLLHCLLMLSH
jgi:hypothetical protein